MLDPVFNADQFSLGSSVPWIGILTASIAGSAHCAGMCGGLMFAVTGTRHQLQLAYHAGRGLAYTAAGILAGAIGHFALNPQTPISGWSDWVLPLQMFFTVWIGIFLMILGIQILWKGRFGLPVHSRWVEKAFRSFIGSQLSWRRACGVGVLTIFLPCGWLMTFVLMALASRDPLVGAAMLFVFWMGTIPLLASIRILGQSLMHRFRLRFKTARWIALGMVILGLSSVFHHLWPYFGRNRSLQSSSMHFECLGGDHR